jgi:hypothetical protein
MKRFEKTYDVFDVIDQKHYVFHTAKEVTNFLGIKCLGKILRKEDKSYKNRYYLRRS